MTPVYGSYAGTVSFSVTGLPSGATATFSPSYLPASGDLQPVVMSVLVPQNTTANVPRDSFGRSVLLFALHLLPSLGSRRVHSAVSYATGPSNNPKNGITTSASSMAVQAGGGVDYNMKHRLGLLVVQIDYLRNQLPNGITQVQNSIRVAKGLTFIWANSPGAGYGSMQNLKGTRTGTLCV